MDPVVSRLQTSTAAKDAGGDPGGGGAFALLGSIGWVVTGQLTSLANELPQHTENLQHKLADLRSISHGGVVEKVQQMIEAVLREPRQAAPPRLSSSPGTEPERPVPVVVQTPSVLWSLPSLLKPLASAGLVLVIFTLLKHSDLRNRLIRIAGYGQPATATKALDEAGQRISRYLLMQSIINGSFGLGVFPICIAALPPGTTTPTRYLCKRLRTRFPACKILVRRWGWTGESDANRALLLAARADAVGLTLRESGNQVRQWGTLDAAPTSEGAPPVGLGPYLPDVSPSTP